MCAHAHYRRATKLRVPELLLLVSFFIVFVVVVVRVSRLWVQWLMMKNDVALLVIMLSIHTHRHTCACSSKHASSNSYFPILLRQLLRMCSGAHELCIHIYCWMSRHKDLYMYACMFAGKHCLLMFTRLTLNWIGDLCAFCMRGRAPGNRQLVPSNNKQLATRDQQLRGGKCAFTIVVVSACCCVCYRRKALPAYSTCNL